MGGTGGGGRGRAGARGHLTLHGRCDPGRARAGASAARQTAALATKAACAVRGWLCGRGAQRANRPGREPKPAWWGRGCTRAVYHLAPGFGAARGGPGPTGGHGAHGFTNLGGWGGGHARRNTNSARAHTHARARTQTHTHARARAHTRTHTHTHTHTMSMWTRHTGSSMHEALATGKCPSPAEVPCHACMFAPTWSAQPSG
jgi:hypothetical protein